MATITINFGTGLIVTKTFTAQVGKEVIEGHLQELQATARPTNGVTMASTDLEKITWFLEDILKAPVQNNRQFRAKILAEAARQAELDRLAGVGFG